MGSFPLNDNIPSSYRTPGFFFSFLFTDPGAPAPNKRALHWHYVPAGSDATPNVPFLPTSQDEVDRKCVPGSPLWRMYVAGKTAGLGVETWLLPIPEPAAGTKATHLVTCMARPVAGTNGTNTTAQADSPAAIYFGLRGASFKISRGDTFAAIMTKAYAALSEVEDLPVAVSLATDTITGTDRCKGEHGNDMPVRCVIENPACGVAFSCGTITATGAATASGTATVTLNVHKVGYDITNGDAVTATAAGLRTKINEDAYCVTAAIDSPATGVVTLFYRDDPQDGRGAHRISVSVTGVTGQTLAAAVGTAGAGVGSVTIALGNLTGYSEAWGAMAVPFLDSTTWNSLAPHIIGQAETPVEKDQQVFFCDTRGLEDIATSNLAASTSPKLTSDIRFCESWQQGATVPGYELAARLAGMLAQEDYAARNFNGRRLFSSARSPLGLPHRADQPTAEQYELAMATYKLAPISVSEEGYNVVKRSQTTYKAKGTVDRKAEKWSFAKTIGELRRRLRAKLARFGDKSLKANSPPRTDNAISPDSVKDAIFEVLDQADSEDLFDGADAFREAIQAGIKVSPLRVDIVAPLVPPADLDQIVGVGLLS
jgi:phage tail sheath gpL-like